MKNMNQLMKQAKKLQEDMGKAQESLGTMTVIGTASGDAVTIEMNGHRKVESVKIKQDVVNPDDVEMLEDLILTALNDANQKIEVLIEEQMGKYTRGLNIPGLF
ncbi:MAG: YbaB/EbfC family nucleoid-associated protein [Acidibacillus sp.]|uniref:Nucleoid-associated protein MM817_00912 n=1 Tax=Sulfoacidibacillus ferrooxidans TaxID=2005001 RepID=A0A9X1VAZ3_9BACL|nr:YbaB/EbfC family nucleoid-associated protein [Sulfoacidibacillus ferrooxidans]MCI0182647.1 Nucleoid-associated protein [Sulfoacidibacillus ferrooxidans]MCY0894081.1 YbaB/EbfC family nucleoid-associated protein [Acidibacillus sp.]